MNLNHLLAINLTLKFKSKEQEPNTESYTQVINLLQLGGRHGEDGAGVGTADEVAAAVRSRVDEVVGVGAASRGRVQRRRRRR
jgi:hypothetical protein